MKAKFYSSTGAETAVQFDAVFLTTFTRLTQIQSLSASAREVYKNTNIVRTLQFLFGPLTNRSLGSPQKGASITVRWSEARLIGGHVLLPYTYNGTWIVSKNWPVDTQLPVPLNEGVVLTPNWKRCTDSAPEHQTLGFYWYFWDPERPGCDHSLGQQYQLVRPAFGPATANTTESFPEYGQLLNSNNRANHLQLTFAFGYIEDQSDPHPDSDFDAGILEYQQFVRSVRQKWAANFTETKILEKEYPSAINPNKSIGHRFHGVVNNVDVTINVVAAAEIDQMELFAKSFAHDHDSFFGWFGHSRVGSGFDADNFRNMVWASPDYYSISPQYQLIYWGGCNSYSYYTLPFFSFKADASQGRDPNGTKGLDIIANGLPSYFMLNASNASIVLDRLMRWQNRPSYQNIINALEANAKNNGGIEVLIAVLGDEDNS